MLPGLAMPVLFTFCRSCSTQQLHIIKEVRGCFWTRYMFSVPPLGWKDTEKHIFPDLFIWGVKIWEYTGDMVLL